MSINLRKPAWIQPRTSSSKFAALLRKFISTGFLIASPGSSTRRRRTAKRRRRCGPAGAAAARRSSRPSTRPSAPPPSLGMLGVVYLGLSVSRVQSFTRSREFTYKRIYAYSGKFVNTQHWQTPQKLTLNW